MCRAMPRARSPTGPKKACSTSWAGISIEASFLDLFAGTGSVGIEALSRGASFARFIDSQRQAIETMRYNLQITGLEQKAEVLRMDAFSYLERAS